MNPRPPASVVWSETAANVAYVAVSVAVLAMLFPGVRYRLQRAAAEIGYELRMALWRATHGPPPAWLSRLDGQLPDEPR